MSHTPTCNERIERAATAELYWIPLGAGSPVVRASGRVFETISARRHRRPRGALYHAALVVNLPSEQFTIEQAPVPDDNGGARGVVAVGPVGHRCAGRWRLFRYEVRCWRDGIIPDIDEAVDSPVCLTTDTDVASLIVELLPMVPTPVWGRDHAHTGEMWNSNSVIAWVLTRSGLDTVELTPPSGGRAPGWAAGRAVARAHNLKEEINRIVSDAQASLETTAADDLHRSGGRSARATRTRTSVGDED